MLVRLPAYVLEEVLSYCTASDKLNVMCCNTDHQLLVQHILWRSSLISIHFKDLATFLPEKTFKFFENTVALSIDCRVRLGSYIASFNMGCNLTKILAQIEAKRLKYLTIGNVQDADIVGRILMKSTYVRQLALYRVKLDGLSSCETLKRMVNGNTLKSLQLEFCDVSNDFIKHMCAKNKLQSVVISYCSTMSGECLSSLCELSPSITHLTIESAEEDQEEEWDIKCLDRLINLKYLHLNGISFTDSSFAHVCKKLLKLEVVKLHSTKLTNDDFVNIGSMSSLKSLDLYHCQGLTSGLFEHLKDSTLCDLVMDLDLFEQVPVDALRDDVSILSDITQLKDVTIMFEDFTNPVYSHLFVMVLNALCWNVGDRDWKLASAEEGKYAFKRKLT